MQMRTSSELTSEAPPSSAGAEPRVTVVIPCLNEAETIEECVGLAFAALRDGGLSGEVLVDGRTVTNPASMVRPGDPVVHRPPVALRGEAKLRPALLEFGIDVTGKVALDVGACTGGFTKVLLEAGASRVYAVDAGHGQLLGSLRQDPRVVNLEATNVGELTCANIPEPVEVISIDVSYLSLSAAIEQVGRVTIARDADLIGLIKPMFELRRATAPADDESLAAAVALATEGAISAGWRVVGTMRSPVTGRGGAIEYLLHARWQGAPEGGPQ